MSADNSQQPPNGAVTFLFTDGDRTRDLDPASRGRQSELITAAAALHAGTIR